MGIEACAHADARGWLTPLAKIEGRKRFGIIGDHLGSPTMLATEAGEIAWRAQLDVYGVPREEEGVAGEERTQNPWRFPGQYEDAETGLYYNRFRYYDPELGRYLSEDPIGLRGGQALFGYVTNSILWIDPHGLTGAYSFEFDTGEVYVGKGPENRFQTSQRKRSRQLPDSTIAKKAHLDFGSDKMGLMVEAELMRRHGFGLPDTKLINAITSPGEALLAAASAAERRKARDLANKLEKKAGIGCK